MKVAVFHNLASGGAKRALRDTVRQLAVAGHTVDAFVPSTADESFLPLGEVARSVTVARVGRTVRGGLRSLRLGRPPLSVSVGDLAAVQQRLAATIDGGAYDVAFVEQDRYTMTPFILKFLRTPAVYYCQQPARGQEAVLRVVAGRASASRPATRVLQRAVEAYFAWHLQHLDRANAAWATRILANSYFSRENILRAYGVNASVCYLGVDTDLFRPGSGAREAFVLSVGSCVPSKGHDFVIAAVGLLPAAARPRLVIVANAGDPGWQRHLETRAREEGVDLDVRRLVSDGELAALYGAARAVLCAPHLEPFGLVTLEAMACGTPVVAVKEGGLRETVIHGETGLLADRDARAFAGAVEEALRDEGRRRALIAGGLDAVHGFWTVRHAGARAIAHLEQAARR